MWFEFSLIHEDVVQSIWIRLALQCGQGFCSEWERKGQELDNQTYADFRRIVMKPVHL